MQSRAPALVGLALACASMFGATPSPLALDSLPAARYEFAGPVGRRTQANLENWLLCAPQANPGLLEMFRLRDRQPAPQLVPWAGEFVGKYLISAVQAIRLSADPRLRAQTAEVVAQLIAAQAEDGYLGPFPKAERLLKNWDLWGHYHAILALALWHEHTGDPAALAAARKAGDLVCTTYLDSGRRVFDAGDQEMNMAILTGMTLLHRLTQEPRYLRMAREVEKDWERAGDYLRSGLDGREFYQSPRPRWESLHDLQGLPDLWSITGEVRYRDALVHHWRSIRRWDRRNTGGFSSGEQATGNPYANTAIETCCTVAWMALTIDYLRLTGDPRAADALELATLNGGLGAQHPSGRWWTYSTPMDGLREASAHAIVFQARAGAPELNCCSVNGPRILGMLSDWAVMARGQELVLNWLGSGRFTIPRSNGAPVVIASSQEAWRDGRGQWQVLTPDTKPLTLQIRIPSWASAPKLLLNGAPVPATRAGDYVRIQRTWQATDRLEFSSAMPLRAVAGAKECAGKVSLYRGPLLLAFDQAENQFDDLTLPAVDLPRLAEARLAAAARPEASLEPWLLVEVPAIDGGLLRLSDFASAGARGTRYRSWLTAKPSLPPPAFTQLPADAAKVPPGPVAFRWQGARGQPADYRAEFSLSEAFPTAATWTTNLSGNRMILDTAALGKLGGVTGKRIFWRIATRNAAGETQAEVPPAWFAIDPAAPRPAIPTEPVLGPEQQLISHSLRGGKAPEFGESKAAQFTARTAEGTELNGRDQKLVYAVPAWPESDFTVRVRVRIKELPQQRLGQVFCAWAASMDDPLRLVVEGGKLFARIEAGQVYTTAGAPIEAGSWHAVAAVKQGETLTLYLDGRAIGSCRVPEFNETRAADCALGGNPHFSGNEHLAAQFADFHFDARALAPQELERPPTP